MYKHNKQKIVIKLIICTIYIIIFTFMASGYSILKTKLTIEGKSSITTEIPKEWNPRIEFRQTSVMGNLFFYDIIIHNDTDKVYKDWKLKIYDAEYITFSEFYSFDGIREENYWLLDNTKWDNRLEPNSEVTVTITFEVSPEVEENMELEEYAEYFLKEFVKVTGDSNNSSNRNGKIIKKNNATLTLKENEIQITDFKIERMNDYKPTLRNEKQYVITISNNSDKTYTKIRGNIYLGKNTLLEISPSEITCIHEQDSTFEIPIWVQVPPGENASIYIMIIVEDESNMSDIVLAGLT